MDTYKYGCLKQHSGVKFYAIHKKTFFGWKELQWWKYDDDGKERMMEAVKQLKDKGHLVL